MSVRMLCMYLMLCECKLCMYVSGGIMLVMLECMICMYDVYVATVRMYSCSVSMDMYVVLSCGVKSSMLWLYVARACYV